jgi:hypothetical protein
MDVLFMVYLNLAVIELLLHKGKFFTASYITQLPFSVAIFTHKNRSFIMPFPNFKTRIRLKAIIAA